MSLTGILVVAAVVLLAVLVGAAIPTLLQLRSTLKSVETLLNETRPKLSALLDQASEASGRINRAASALEECVGRVRGVIDAAGALGSALESARDSLRKTAAVVSAIGPALAAGFRAFFPSGDDGPAAPESAESAEPQEEASGPGQPSEEA